MNDKKVNINTMPIIEDDVIGVGSVTDFSKSLKVLFNDDNINKKSDLKPKQICKLNILYEMAKEYQVPLLVGMCNRFIELRVSKDRKGRGEAVSMTQQISVLKRLEAMESQMHGGRK